MLKLTLVRCLYALGFVLLAACGGGDGSTNAGAAEGSTGSGSGGATSGVVQAISLTPPNASAHWGGTIELTAQATDAAAAAVTGQTITYTSSDNSIATVSNAGLVTLINPGTVNITASIGSVTSNASVINVKGFAAGTLNVFNDTNCAIDTTKTEVFCWGYPYFNDLNLPGALLYSVPTKLKQGQVPADATITSVSHGFKHSCLLTSQGDAYCWAVPRPMSAPTLSADEISSMGTNSASPISEPALVARGEIPPGIKITKLISGSRSTCALADDGNIYCWGMKQDLPKPAIATTLSNVFAVPVKIGVIGAGVKFVDFAMDVNKDCAISDAGQLYCAYGHGYLAPVTNPASELPANVKLTKIKASAGEGGHMMVLGDDGWTYSFAGFYSHSYGNGTRYTFGVYASNQLVRTGQGMIPIDEKIIDFSPGGDRSSNCIVTTTGKAYCWGMGTGGTLGAGSVMDALEPMRVAQGELPVTVKFASIVCGLTHCSALGTNQKVYTWGNVARNTQPAAPAPNATVRYVPTLLNKVRN